MHSDKHSSIWFLLHRAVRFDQHRLLKMLSVFFPVCFWLFHLKYQASIGVWHYALFFNLTLLINMSVFVLIYYYGSTVHLETGNGDISCSSCIIQDCFNSLGIFVFTYTAEKNSFKICEELCWNFEIALNYFLLLLIGWPFLLC